MRTNLADVSESVRQLNPDIYPAQRAAVAP
jgi:hypothetical protein